MNNIDNKQKKMALINDFSGYGRCSITVQMPIISAMKIQCCPIPTAIFSNHTGYESFYKTDYTEYMRNYIEEWKKLNLKFDGICTGYLGSYEQIEIVKEFLSYFAKQGTKVFIDPVMGDNGKLYPSYSTELSLRMRELIKYADTITPNLTEACILTNTAYDNEIDDYELKKICDKLKRMGPKNVVISGIVRGKEVGNYISDAKCSKLVMEDIIGETRSGTGDVFSAILASCMVKNIDLIESVDIAVKFIRKTIIKTIEYGVSQTDGICIEEYLSDLGLL